MDGPVLVESDAETAWSDEFGVDEQTLSRILDIVKLSATLNGEPTEM